MATTHGLGSQRSRWHAPLGRMVRQVAEVVGVTPMDGGRTRPGHPDQAALCREAGDGSDHLSQRVRRLRDDAQAAAPGDTAMTNYRGVAIGLAAAAGFAGMQWLGRAAGATSAERESRLPGDGLIEHPMMVTTHAITIDAPREAVWPWLVQMGWHRGQWYTARWVDRLLFPANEPSADHIVPELQQLSVGDWVPDGAPETGCGFVVDFLEANRHLVLHSTEHLPPQFAERFGAWIDWTWAFTLHRLGPGRTRLVIRSRVCLGPWWLAAGYWALIIPADFVMARQMMHGVKARAEALTSASAHRQPAQT